MKLTQLLIASMLLFGGISIPSQVLANPEYTLDFDRISFSASSRISYADAISKASAGVPKGYAIQSQTLRKIGGKYFCFLICIKVK